MTEQTQAPRVFVIQQPSVWDSGSNRFLPKYDLSPARQWGKLTLVLGPGNIFADQMRRAMVHMKQVLASYTPRDYLLAIGDPVAIAAGAMLAGRASGGEVKLLKWDRLSGTYKCFPISTGQGENDEKRFKTGT